MDIQNVINSTSYIDTINKLDNLINELLYSKDNGYINLISKDALDNAQKVIEKFDFEADKIVRECCEDNIAEIANIKKQELTIEVKKHYKKQALDWSYNVFEQTIQNCILKASIHSKEKDITNAIFKNVIDIVEWISNVHDYSQNEKEDILNKIIARINSALNARDYDYLEKNSPEKSNCETYLKIRCLIKSDTNQFINLDLNNYKFELSIKDSAYFSRQINLLKSNKNAVIDEIDLVDYFLNSANINDNEQKYQLISQIQDDLASGENMDEKEKSEIIARRIAIFKDKDKYYKKLLGF